MQLGAALRENYVIGRAAVSLGCVLALAAGLGLSQSGGTPTPARAAATSSPPTAAASQPATRPALTFATYNICFANRDLKTVLKTLQQCQADLVALQETNDQSLNFLRPGLAKLYPHVFFQNAPAAAGGLAFFSKLPLKGARYLRPTVGWFGGLEAQVVFSGATVLVENIHLHPTVPDPKAGPLAALELFVQTEKIRGQEIELICKNLPPDKRVVMLGDFNSSPDWAATTFLAKRGFVDSFAAVTPNAATQPTWRANVNGSEYRYHLDYIFHDAGFKTLASRIVQADASDHFMVVSRLELPPAGPTSKP